MRRVWRRIPHRSILATGFTVAVIAVVLRITRENPAAIISLSTVLATIPVSVSFAASQVLQGVIAGRVLTAERKFRVGQTMTIVGFTGTVEEISLRTTLLRGANQERILVPNSVILTSAFTVTDPKEQ